MSSKSKEEMPVGVTVGGWFASVVISRLINGLIDYAKEYIDKWDEMEDEMKRLKKALPKIQAVVTAVDQGLIREENPPLNAWLWQLRDAADMADDVMDEFEYNEAKEKANDLETKENDVKTNKPASDFKTHLDTYVKRKMRAGKNKVRTAVTNITSFLKQAFIEDPILKRLKEALKAIDEVASDVGDFYILVQNLKLKQQEMVQYTRRNRVTSSLLNVETRVFGRDKVRDEIVDKLLKPGYQTTAGNFCVLPIVGVGGVGKTTLAQFVYNDQRVVNHFNLRMWVCVSKPFDVELLTKKLYELACGKKPDSDHFEWVQPELAKELQSKKFLIVLDDAWNDDDRHGWQKLFAPLKSGDKGSMILLTTRMKEVAKTNGQNMMDPIFLEGLEKDEYWNLFVQYAFGDENRSNHKKLEEIGRTIVKKLKGSPLAAKTLGRVLNSNLCEEHWTNVMESDIWSLKHQKNDIIPALSLSYEHLDSHLKPCFSFCSLFPQDHEFNKEDLIYMWMAVGLVPRHGDCKMIPEYVGSEFFDELVNKSLLECRSSRRKDTTYFMLDIWDQKKGRIDHYVMHDLLHDLATFISKEECFRFTGCNSSSIPPTVRYLSVHVTDLSEFKFSGLAQLRTLILTFDEDDEDGTNYLHFINGVIKKLKKLRLLHLSSDNLQEFPHCVSDLLHLRYLYTGGMKLILPSKISNLYLLQNMSSGNILIKHDNQEFNVGNLVGLRNLTFHTLDPVKLIGLGRLTSLRDIGTKYCVNESGHIISDLKNMTALTDLSLSEIGYVGCIEEAIQANLRNKVNLQRLCLSWYCYDSRERDAEFDEQVLDRLEPHSHLNTLLIQDHWGRRPPVWMGEPSTFQLEKLSLSKCRWECLPSLEELPYLKFLEIRNMDSLKQLCHNCSGASHVGNFSSLEKLCLCSLRELEEWSLRKQHSIWMPCLRELEVLNCPKLNSSPPLPASLESLTLSFVGLVTLPDIWHGCNNSNSSPSLVELAIFGCSKLASLSLGMFEHPEYFKYLRKLEILKCEELMHLPQGGFSKFVALDNLVLNSCRRLVPPEYFLPSSLESLEMRLIGSSDVTFPIALEHVDSIVSLKISECSVASLTPKGVFGRWKNLREVKLIGCKELVTLECLKLVSIDILHVERCSKLISEIPPQPELHNDILSQTNTIATGTLTNFKKWFSVFLACLRNLLVLCIAMFSVSKMILSERVNAPILRMVSTPMDVEDKMEIPIFSVNELIIDDPSLLDVEPLRSLSSVQKLTITNCSKIKILPVQWLLHNRNSIREINLAKLFSLESLPVELKSLSCLQKLKLQHVSKLQSLPELPAQLEKIIIRDTSEELKRRCRVTGEDWPKLAGKVVDFGKDFDSSEGTSDQNTINEE